jgi:hypothetical protein
VEVDCTTSSSQRNCFAVPALALSLPLSLGSGGRRTLGAEELSRDVQGLAAHNDNLLSVEQLLGDGTGKATEKVPLAVDDLIHKSARGSGAMLRCRGSWAAPRSAAAANLGGVRVVVRRVRTMTGSKVDMVSNPGVMLEVS